MPLIALIEAGPTRNLIPALRGGMIPPWHVTSEYVSPVHRAQCLTVEPFRLVTSASECLAQPFKGG